MKKRSIVILIILLAIGFAAVSTTLVLNGTIGIAANKDDFNIIFTNAKLNNVERKDFIDPETKQTITFETNKLTKVDEEAVLDYEVTNTSKLYDGDVKIVCNLVDKDDNIIEDYEYIGITYEPKSMTVEAGKKETGSITAKLKKAATEDGSVKLKCRLDATAKERDKIPDDDPEPGDEVCYDTECFYVIKSDEFERKLLAKYNLYVGGGHETGPFKEYGEEATGKQNVNMKGVTSSGPPTGTMAFSADNSVNYETSLIKPIIDEYTNYLKDEYGIDGKGGLLTKADLEELVGQNLSYGAKLNEIAPDVEWLYDRSYWMQDVNGSNVDIVVASGYQYVYTSFNTNNTFGVRPVITITLKEKPGMLKEYEYSDKFWKYSSSITKVVFENALQEKEGYAYKFDVSEQGNGSVMSYLVANKNDTSTYTLYIQEDGKVIANPNSSFLFYSFSRLETIEGLEYFDTSLATNMASMFYSCSNLTTLDLRSFNTSKVKNMERMFEYCSRLTTLNLSKFNTSNVTNMSEMFYYCNSLTTLDVSNFNTSSVQDMSRMFYNCDKLTTLNVDNFNTSNVTNMSEMFYYCNSLTTLDVSNFNTSSVTNMASMFYNCDKLTTLNVDNFNTSNVTNMSEMFSNCSKLAELDLSNFNTSSVTNMEQMFDGCNSLTELNISNFNTSNVQYMSRMFRYCSKLSTLNVSGFDTSSATSMFGMFWSCLSLTTLDVSNFDTSNVTNMSLMFRYCESLTSLDLSNFKTSNVTNMSGMFMSCIKLTSLDLSNFKTGNVTNMSEMFMQCTKLTTLDLSSFNTSNVTNMASMFERCSSLTSLDLSNFKTGNVTNMSEMFMQCTKLTTLDLSSFNTSNVTNMSNMFNNSYNLITLDISSFDVSKVTDTSFMFSNVTAKVYVKDATVQNWVLTSNNGRPPYWSTSTVVIKEA